MNTLIDPGEGWRLLEPGEPLQKGDGFLHLACKTIWLDYECRPDIFRVRFGVVEPGLEVNREYAHTYPWRRRISGTSKSEELKKACGIESLKVAADVEWEACSSCDGCGSISYNPNLNPNSFSATASAKCTHCNGTGRVAAEGKPEDHNPSPYKFRAGDIVLHCPTGEKWVLACDEENGEVMPCGWPPTIAKASDCGIRKTASDNEHLEMLLQWSNRTETDELMDQRSTLARHQLDKMKQTEAPTPPTGTMETIIQEILQHDKDNPGHGIGCSCMDKHAVSLRRLFSESGMYKGVYQESTKSLRNLMVVLMYISNNP